MSDNKGKKNTPVRVADAVLEGLRDEQYRRRKAGLLVPTQAELITEAWNSFAGSDPPKRVTGKSLIEFPAAEIAELKSYREASSSPEKRRLLELLVKILNSGIHDAIEASEKALTFCDEFYVKKDGPPDSGSGGGKRQKR